jgi:putative ABC transport system permease protein
MIKSYFKIAWRNLLKSKAYSSVNVIGLATGMAVALLIGLWIWDELSFNHYHDNHKKLARIMATQTFNGETGTYPTTCVPLEKELRTKYASDFKRLSLTWNSTNILAAGDKKISQPGLWAQPDLPEMLTLKMNKGSRSAFNDPSSIMLSASVALALFGNDDPVNKTVRVDNKTDMKVAGVYADLPRNTTLYGTKFLLPWDNKANWWNTQGDAWSNHGCQLIVEVNEGVDFSTATDKIKKITQEHGYVGSNELLSLHPMNNWHLYSEFKNGKEAGGRIQFVWLFGIIGVFVLLLACINFMNLSTARSEKRAKEVGIRKAIGSMRGQLISQFLSESLLVSFLALLFAIALVQLTIGFFNEIADKNMAIPWTTPLFWLVTVGFTFITGVISGSYPAFYLSGFEPIRVLKGTFRAGRLAAVPRKVLVVVQFTVSITLIIGTIIVYRQVHFAKDRPVGYASEGLVSVVMNTPEIYEHYDAMRSDLLQTGVVENMAESNSPVTQVSSNNNGLNWQGKDPNSDPLFGTIAVTHDFGKTVGWKIAEGRDFSRAFNDTGAFILNEAAVKVAGLKDPIGKKMKWLNQDHVITGIVKDMVMESPFKPAIPTIFQLRPDWVSLITVKIKPGTPLREALGKIEPVFKKYNPASPFEYTFIEDEYAQKFSDEERIGNLATFFAILAIFISCLGLFGLASFVAEQRTKEIGVRKVLGASVFNLWKMLSKDFVLLVFISCFIAVPIAWYFLNQWLQKYEYRAPASWWVFAVAIGGALIITLFTVSFQAIRAAVANPVKSLRTE